MVSDQHPVREGFASASASNNTKSKLNNLRNNKNNKKLAAVSKNNAEAVKKKNRNRIRENLENVDIQPDGSHVLDSDYIKNKIADYYNSFDHKVLRKKGTDMNNFNNKMKFFKEQFWNIFDAWFINAGLLIVVMVNINKNNVISY